MCGDSGCVYDAWCRTRRLSWEPSTGIGIVADRRRTAAAPQARNHTIATAPTSTSFVGHHTGRRSSSNTAGRAVVEIRIPAQPQQPGIMLTPLGEVEHEQVLAGQASL